MIDSTIGTHVAHNAARFPNKLALIDPICQMTYRELDQASNRIANAILAQGLGRGSNVSLLAKSDAQFVALFIGIAKAGATMVPLNYRLTPPEIAATIEDAESPLLFVSSEFLSRAGGAYHVKRTVVIDGTGNNSLAAFLTDFDDVAPSIRVDAEDTQLIMYTGGTTGRSKGVVLTHANVFWNTINMIVDTKMHPNDNTVLATPLHHAAALNCWLIPHLYLGATSTILSEYSPERMLIAIATHRCTNGFSPPSMARELYSHPLARELDLSCFSRWYVGGATMSRKDRNAMHELLPNMTIYYQYGITEAGPMVSVLQEDEYDRAPGSIGRAFQNLEIKILRADLTDAPVDEVGEIAVRGPQVMKCYYKQPDATAAAFHESWLRTGDLGSLDSSGYLTFHDRLKDMIKTGGLNVYSQEVEQALQRHPAIREVAIIGLPSERWGEEVTGVVVVRDGALADAEEIIAFGKERLAHYKVPKRIIFLDYSEMPINYSGKILKRELRKKVAAAS